MNDVILRLERQVIRLREEANMDDRAATNTSNEDARPYFTAWANDKRQFADDIEKLLEK